MNISQRSRTEQQLAGVFSCWKRSEKLPDDEYLYRRRTTWAWPFKWRIHFHQPSESKLPPSTQVTHVPAGKCFEKGNGDERQERKLYVKMDNNDSKGNRKRRNVSGLTDTAKVKSTEQLAF